MKFAPAKALAVALALLASCASTVDADRLQESMGERPFFNEQTTLEDLQNQQPTIEMPFRLGVAPPWVVGKKGADFGSWAPEERERLEEWIQRGQERGVITDGNFIPSMVIDGSAVEGSSLMEQMRLAGARQHVDAILLVQRATDKSTWNNELSFFYPTIIGMYVVPGTEVEALTMTEGFIVEVGGDGYMHAAAQGSGQAEGLTTNLRSSELLSKKVMQSRVSALDALCRDLLQSVERPRP